MTASYDDPQFWQKSGTSARFLTSAALYQAAQALHQAGYTCWDTYTPFPMHGLDKAMGLKRSKIPFLTFLGGLTGLLLGIAIVWYMNAYDYALIIGGKPFFSPIFPFPIFYELTILLAAFGTFSGMFLFNQLPMHYHPIFDVPGFEKASDDTFFVFISDKDPLFDKKKTPELLLRLGGDCLHTLTEPLS